MRIKNILLAGICAIAVGCINVDKERPIDVPYLWGQQYLVPVNYCINETTERTICFNDEAPYGSLDSVTLMDGSEQRKIASREKEFVSYAKKWEEKIRLLYLR